MRKVVIENNIIKEAGTQGKPILCCNHIGYPCNSKCAVYLTQAKTGQDQTMGPSGQVAYCNLAKCIIGWFS